MAVIGIINALFIIIFTAHILGCAFTMIADSESVDLNWMTHYEPSLLGATNDVRYITAIYWAMIRWTAIIPGIRLFPAPVWACPDGAIQSGGVAGLREPVCWPTGRPSACSDTSSRQETRQGSAELVIGPAIGSKFEGGGGGEGGGYGQ